MELYKIFSKFIFLLPPELCHYVAILLLKYRLIPSKKSFHLHKSLHCRVFGCDFETPLGLAAGFDKDADGIYTLSRQGFGFVEYGTVTPLMQIGNPKPRLFRLLKEQALINAMGFNNKGVEYFIKNIKDYLQTSNKTFTKIGVNIGMNRDGKIDDYIFMLEKVANFADYVVVNISSPNTPGLRTIENDNTKLTQLLHNLNEKRKDMMNNIPILVKISPDNIDNNHIYNIANAIFDNKVDGIIISNTTIQCSDIRDKYNLYKGGLSGIPLFSISNDVLKSFYKLTSGKVPIIANGGVSSAHDVYTKIKLGASLVQIYTAFVYQGPGLINKIYRGLIDLLDRDGYKSISEAVGVGL